MEEHDERHETFDTYNILCPKPSGRIGEVVQFAEDTFFQTDRKISEKSEMCRDIVGFCTALDEDRNGDIEFHGQGRMLDGRRFRKTLEYVPDDIPEVLKATYKFFARDRRLLPHIMEGFLREAA